MLNLAGYLAYRFPDGEPVGEQTRVECPSCHHHNKKAFIHTDTGKSYCFHCGWKAGGWTSLIYQMEGLTSREALSEWVTLHRTAIESHGYASAANYVRARYAMPMDTPAFSHALDPGDEYCDYLESRGFSYITAEIFRMQKCVGGRYANRIIIPVYEKDTLVYFFDRSIEPAEERKTLGVGTQYAYWPVKKSSVVFNTDNVAQYVRNGGRRVYIAEGIFSALSLGTDNVLATLGKNVTSTQVSKILGTGATEFVVCMDPDALRNARDLAESLIKQSTLREIDVYIREYTEGDPNDYLVKRLRHPEDVPYDLKYKMRRAMFR